MAADSELSSGSIEIEIFYAAKDFYLKKLLVTAVMDSEVDNTAPLSSVPVRELVVQFEKMKPNQMFMLDYFLKKYTIK